MKNRSRYTGWILPAFLIAIMLGMGGVCFGATPQAAAGATHTIFLHADGTLWGTGFNLFGQLGDGSFINRNAPVQIGSGSSWKAVSAGAEHNLALQADGTLWAWGRSDSGQLGRVSGNGSPVSNRNAPVQIGTERNWTAVAAGSGSSSFALKGDGTLWAWGSNASGQLGDGSTSQQNIPVQVANPGASRYVAIACGGDHALALQADGTLWAWGQNSSGQLGDGSLAEQHVPVQVLIDGAVTDNNWAAIAAGSSHSVGLKSDGTLWAWGGNTSGQLGIGSTLAQPTPVQIGAERDWSTIGAGSLHTLALKRNGTLWAFGDNRSGQIGNGLTSAQQSPVQISSPAAIGNMVALTGGALHSLALKANGELYAWGDNGAGQFGNGSALGSLIPLQVGSELPGWVYSEQGNQFTLARRSDGTLWSWGDNSNGELGDGSLDQRSKPAPVGTQDNWAAHAAGFAHVAALRADGTLWSWGDNSSGQLGDNTVDPSLIPLQITDTTPISASNDWAAVAAGDFHTLALKADGTLWSWGDNSSGQLGDSSNAPNGKKPNQVLTTNPGDFDSNWIAIAAGGSHSLGLQSDGTLWVWGDNSLGQLGDPSIIGSVNFPSQIVNLSPPAANLGFNSGWKAIAAGLGHSLALQADGTLWAWGSNFDGQLGNGDATLPNPPAQTAPVQVVNGGAAWYLAIAAGDAHSAARRADGTLWSWGRNTSGQLGSRSTDPLAVPNATPVQEAGGASDWIAAGVGGSHSVALKADGTLWAFGSNFNGQLGDGSALDRDRPAPLLEGFVKVARSLAFNTLAIGGSASSLPLIISNPGNGSLFVTGITLAGSNPAPFSVQAGSCPSAASFTLATRASCTLNVVFTPAAPQGAKSALLVIDSSDPLQPQAQVDLSATSMTPFVVTTSSIPAGLGTVSPAGPILALPGTSPVFAIAPAAGYHIAGVTLNGTSIGAASSVTLTSINSDTVIAASFAINSYNVTLNAGPHGGISGPTTATFGATPSYTITPDPGSFITGVTVGGVAQGVVATVTLAPVNADVTIAASFDVTTFGVSAASAARGSVSPSGTTLVPYGSSQTYNFTPNPGYNVVEVVADGVKQGPVSSYTFNNVTGNGHTIKVVFIPDGDLTGDGLVTIADALKALRIAVGLNPASAGEMLHGDVAPLDAGGIPVPDTQIKVADALLILRKAVGLASGF